MIDWCRYQQVVKPDAVDEFRSLGRRGERPAIVGIERRRLARDGVTWSASRAASGPARNDRKPAGAEPQGGVALNTRIDWGPRYGRQSGTEAGDELVVEMEAPSDLAITELGVLWIGEQLE